MPLTCVRKGVLFRRPPEKNMSERKKKKHCVFQIFPFPSLFAAFARALVHAEPLTVACQLTTYETARAEQSYANVCRVCTVRVCICTCGAFPRKRPEGERLTFSSFPRMCFTFDFDVYAMVYSFRIDSHRLLIIAYRIRRGKGRMQLESSLCRNETN